ncbi:TadE/TadG family type IV pilus assembly protein [Myxococcus sp. 1LA]
MRLPIRLLSTPARRRAQRGQAIVLGALSFLVLALMVTLSFNLAHALRQKMGLQQHSDALAYSMAVLEARALNYYAVSNRAIAASYVAMNTIHAYMAASSVTGEMLRASAKNFEDIAKQEFAMCSCYGCYEHCLHGFEAQKIASDFNQAGDTYDGKVRGLESRFNAAVRGVDVMVDNLHASQRAAHDQTLRAVRDGTSHGLSLLTEYSMPGASTLSRSVGGLNANEFNCAVDGMDCRGSVENSSQQALAQVMTEVANASRSGWPATRSYKGTGSSLYKPPYLHRDFFQELQDIPGQGTYRVTSHEGTAKTVQDPGEVNSGGKQGGNAGTTSAAQEEGSILHTWQHGLFAQNDYSARVWSDSGGGGHEPDGAHSGSHTFEGVNANALSGCARSGNCFMKFRANPSSDRDWGQPRVYSYLSKRFRVGDTGRAPWELNRSAQIQLDHGAQGTATLTLAAEEGVALSKALVYYHRFGGNGWREAPNLFSPYWRAKLHPIAPDEAVEVLEAAGNTDASRLVQVPGVSL